MGKRLGNGADAHKGVHSFEAVRNRPSITFLKSNYRSTPTMPMRICFSRNFTVNPRG